MIASAEGARASNNGDANDPTQADILETIAAALDGSERSRALAGGVYHRSEQAGGLESGLLTRFLIVAANARALSPSVVASLIARVRVAAVKQERDFENAELARLAAHAMGQVPAAERAPAYRLIELSAGDITPMAGSTAEMLAALGRQGLDQPGMPARVEAEARNIPPYVPTDRSAANSPMPGMTIVVGSGPWMAALAQYGLNRKLVEADAALLRDHFADPTLHDVIAPALVHQDEITSAGSPVDAWVTSLGAAANSVHAREVRAGVISGELAALPRATFLKAIASLRVARQGTIEPEVRYAIGGIIASSLYARVRPAERGAALFQ